ncbi:site-specific integrase [uncultured Desulfobacter sp.]|uniref:site-specific integrase n=1 Tax=uncultured Desulfobacter sp. TaxID=240139 RepID=UPI0029F4E5CF|nr:site-specific integrase [uncultured Desulfobacter sp.]
MQLTKEQISDIIEQYIEEGLDTIENELLPKRPLSEERVDNLIEGTEDVRSMAFENLVTFNYKAVGASADGFLVQRDIEPDKDSCEYRQLCHDLLKAGVGLMDVEVARARGDYEFGFPYEKMGLTGLKERATAPPPAQPAPQPKSPKIADLIESWRTENITADLWKGRTLDRYTSYQNVILQVIGADTPILSVDHETVRHLKETLLKVPSGMNKKTEFRDKTMPQIIEINESKGYPTLSVNTVNGYLTHLGAFFKWCVGQGHMRQNYADGAKIKTRKTKRPDEIRKAFSKADLMVLFGSPDYREDKFKESYHFWLPILALYTGARMNELAQLRLKDIQVVDNVPSLVFQEDPDDPTISIKNAASLRTIPLHPFVAEELNFMGYIQSMKDRGEVRLFPELPYQNNNYGHKATKWFGAYKTRLGLTSKQLVFHSFRHTLTDNLKQQLITETLIDELTGHALQGETMGRYGKRYNVEVLYREAVLKLDYGVNLEHLKKSKWCGYPNDMPI